MGYVGVWVTANEAGNLSSSTAMTIRETPSKCHSKTKLQSMSERHRLLRVKTQSGDVKRGFIR